MSEKTVAGQSIRNWNGKPYHSLDYMLKQTFGEKVYKVTLNGGMSCPNRDGKLGSRGCIFCSAGGSGDFAADAALPITDQIDSQIEMLRAKDFYGGDPSSFRSSIVHRDKTGLHRR